jgi:hypothetical protein
LRLAETASEESSLAFSAAFVNDCIATF